ncbi:hypothetical protein Tco_1478198 [Tanacetum coccineum]
MTGICCFNLCSMNTSNLQVMYLPLFLLQLYFHQISSSSSSFIDSDTFTNLFAPPGTSSAKSSSRTVDTSNMHTFQQPPIYTKRWIKVHPFTTIIGDPSKPVSTRRQLSTDALWCYFHAFLAKEEPKNYKEADEVFLALGWLSEEIHVTWAHLEKKRTRLRAYTKSLKELCIQSVETASQA